MAERGLDFGRDGTVGVLAGLAGAAVFAYCASYAARHFGDVPPLAVATGQQLGAAVPPLSVFGMVAILVGLHWVVVR